MRRLLQGSSAALCGTSLLKLSHGIIYHSLCMNRSQPHAPSTTAAGCDATPHWDAEFDFIVVGAGSSGCAAATRIAQGLPYQRTLLLEAGEDDDVPQIQTSVDYFGKVEHIFGSDRDWVFGSEAQSELANRGMYWPRGKVACYFLLFTH